MIVIVMNLEIILRVGIIQKPIMMVMKKIAILRDIVDHVMSVDVFNLEVHWLIRYFGGLIAFHGCKLVEFLRS
jgi:hypothetical protein